MLHIAALVLALAADANDLVRLPAEPVRSFQCRAEHLPRARACTDRCRASYLEREQAAERWDCVQACTSRTLYALGQCRRAPAPPRAATPLAAR